MFQENFDDDLEKQYSVRRKPVGTAPALPALEFSNSSTDSFTKALAWNSQERLEKTVPKGPRPEPSSGPKLPTTSSPPVENPEYVLAFPGQPRNGDRDHIGPGGNGALVPALSATQRQENDDQNGQIAPYSVKNGNSQVGDAPRIGEALVAASATAAPPRKSSPPRRKPVGSSPITNEDPASRIFGKVKGDDSDQMANGFGLEQHAGQNKIPDHDHDQDQDQYQYEDENGSSLEPREATAMAANATNAYRHGKNTSAQQHEIANRWPVRNEVAPPELPPKDSQKASRPISYYRFEKPDLAHGEKAQYSNHEPHAKDEPHHSDPYPQQGSEYNHDGIHEYEPQQQQQQLQQKQQQQQQINRLQPNSQQHYYDGAHPSQTIAQNYQTDAQQLQKKAQFDPKQLQFEQLMIAAKEREHQEQQRQQAEIQQHNDQRDQLSPKKKRTGRAHRLSLDLRKSMDIAFKGLHKRDTSDSSGTPTTSPTTAAGTSSPSTGTGFGAGAASSNITPQLAEEPRDSTEEYDDDDDARFEQTQIVSGTLRGRHHREEHKRRDADSQQEQQQMYWKYHILKYSKDLYLTTNPDTQHLSRPVGPSYYIDVSTDMETPGQFTLVFNDQKDRQPVMTINKVARTATHDGEGFNISIHSKELLLDKQKSAWVGQAVQVQSEIDLPNGKKTRCKQYAIKDVLGNEWVVGNRPELEVMHDHHHHHEVDVATRIRVSSKIFFFLRGQGGPDSDVILAVFRKRQPKHKRVVKEGMNWINNNGEVLATTPVSGGNNQELPQTSGVSQVDDDDANNEKAGWLYVLDTISKYVHDQPWLWPMVIGLTTAVGHNRRFEHHQEKSLPKFFSNIKHRARGVRWSMHG